MKKFKTLIILLLFLFISNNSYSYADSGRGSPFFQLLLASIIISFLFLKNYIKNVLNSFLGFISDVKNLMYLVSKNREKNIIYCESPSYSVYFEKILEELKYRNIDFFYLCKKNDDNLQKFCLKDNEFGEFNYDLVIITYLSLMKCDNLILTTPDIGNKIKISKNCSKIIYFFHSIVSTSMVYKKDAFYNYTHICCVGRHQIEELFASLSSKKKNIKLFEVGYPYFDYLLEKKKEIKKLETDKKNVLIAPSWNPSSIYSHSYIYEKTITDLLKNQYKVTFRPHPEFIKRFTNDFNKFIQLFENEENFYINSDKNNFHILYNSDYLITDWSGIAFEYAYIFKRPVIFANVKKKVLNIDYDKYNQLPIEITEREEIGLIYNIKGKDKIIELINKINNEKSIYDKKIDDSLKRNIFNPGNSSSFIANLINQYH